MGAAIVRGELKGVPQDEGYKILDQAVMQGSTMAKVLLGVLFADGAQGLKFGCDEATKYFAEEALVFPFFKERVISAQLALRRGLFSFAMVKYMELGMIGYENAFINLLYLLEVYNNEALALRKNSWGYQDLTRNPIYKSLRKSLDLPDIGSFLRQNYDINSHKTLSFN